jgi:hypothetical protein
MRLLSMRAARDGGTQQCGIDCQRVQIVVLHPPQYSYQRSELLQDKQHASHGIDTVSNDMGRHP